MAELTELGALGLQEDVGRERLGYVKRTIDQALSNAFHEASAVVVYGPAKAGKSRTTIEVLRNTYPRHTLLVPARRDALREILLQNLKLTNTVLWLDDLENYVSPDGLSDQVLDYLLRESSCTIVATIRTQALENLNSASARGGAARSLLTRARLVGMERLLDTQELERVKVALPPERFAEVERLGLAPYLSAAPDLVLRYESGHDTSMAGLAIVRAAAVCRKAGVRGPIPDALIHIALELEGDLLRDDFEDGLAWASEPIYGHAAILQRSAEGWTLFDFVYEHILASQVGLRVEPMFYDRISTRNMRYAALLDIALGALEYNYVRQVGRLATALMTAAKDDHQKGVANWMAGKALLASPHVNKSLVVRSMRIAADYGLTAAVLELEHLLPQHRTGREEVRRLLVSVHLRGDHIGTSRLALFLEDQGDVNGARLVLAAHADHDAKLAGELGLLLLTTDADQDEAAKWLRLAVAGGDQFAREALVCLLSAQDSDEAESLLRDLSVGGSSHATVHWGEWLSGRKRYTEAIDVLRKATQGGDADLQNLHATLDSKAARPDDQNGPYEQQSTLNTRARLQLARALYYAEGATVEVEAILESLVQSGFVAARHLRAVVHSDQGRLELAESDFKQALKDGCESSRFDYALLLLRQGRDDEALGEIQCAVLDVGAKAALLGGWLATSLHQPEEAHRLFVLGWGQGGRTSAYCRYFAGDLPAPLRRFSTNVLLKAARQGRARGLISRVVRRMLPAQNEVRMHSRLDALERLEADNCDRLARRRKRLPF